MGIVTNLRGCLPEPLGLANQPHGFLAFGGVQSVNEHNAVEVVSLMLYASSQQITALDDNRLTVHVHASGNHATGPPGVKR